MEEKKGGIMNSIYGSLVEILDFIKEFFGF